MWQLDRNHNIGRWHWQLERDGSLNGTNTPRVTGLAGSDHVTVWLTNLRGGNYRDPHPSSAKAPEAYRPGARWGGGRCQGAPLSRTESGARCTRAWMRACVCVCAAGLWPPNWQAWQWGVARVCRKSRGCPAQQPARCEGRNEWRWNDSVTITKRIVRVLVPRALSCNKSSNAID